MIQEDRKVEGCWANDAGGRGGEGDDERLD
jgi:hypothetical protein